MDINMSPWIAMQFYHTLLSLSTWDSKFANFIIFWGVRRKCQLVHGVHIRSISEHFIFSFYCIAKLQKKKRKKEKKRDPWQHNVEPPGFSAHAPCVFLCGCATVRVCTVDSIKAFIEGGIYVLGASNPINLRSSTHLYSSKTLFGCLGDNLFPSFTGPIADLLG